MCSSTSIGKIAEVKVFSWEEFFHIVSLLSSQAWFYRGHGDENWKLETAFERSRNKYLSRNNQKSVNNHHFEWESIQLFKKDAIKHYDYGNNIEWLSVMQHYGTPTRLLDFTESIMVALYFAYIDTIPDTNKCIWAIKQSAIFMGVEDSVYHFRKFNENDDPTGRVAKELYISNNKFSRENDCRKYAEKLIEDNDSIVTACPKSNKIGILPIFPLINNERMSAQNGLFLMPINFEKSFEENICASLNIKGTLKESTFQKEFDMSILCQCPMIKFIFDYEKCKECGPIFKMTNISTKNLFPGLEGIAKASNLFI